MGSFDKEKEEIRDMHYDSKLGGYTNDAGDKVFKSSIYSDGSGVKYDYYTDVKSGDLNEPHSGKHLNSDLQENWKCDSHNEDKSEWEHNSGTGCYLTSACLQHFQNEFDDNCEELTILRWFRDNYVTKDDIKHYYETAPIIVEAINKIDKCEKIYEYIYEHVVLACVEAIKNGDYIFAYDRYKTSIQTFEEQFARPYLETKLVSVLAN